MESWTILDNGDVLVAIYQKMNYQRSIPAGAARKSIPNPSLAYLLIPAETLVVRSGHENVRIRALFNAMPVRAHRVIAWDRKSAFVASTKLLSGALRPITMRVGVVARFAAKLCFVVSMNAHVHAMKVSVEPAKFACLLDATVVRSRRM